jgi:hypothetical protein
MMMNYKQSGLLVVLALIAGFVGGSASNWFFMGEPVFAQKPSQPPETIRAKQFVVVDETGKTRAVLGTEVDEPAKKSRLKLKTAIQQLPPDSPLAKQYRMMLEQIKTTERATLNFYNSDGRVLVSLYTSWGTDPVMIATHLGFLDDSPEKVQQELLTPQQLSWNDVRQAEVPSLDFNLITSKFVVANLGMGIDATGTSGINLNRSHRGFVGMSVEEEGPSVFLQDEAGYETMIGNGSLETIKTGSMEKRSAASVVLFGKDKKVIWSAP